jgi:hypothetical protein
MRRSPPAIVSREQMAFSIGVRIDQMLIQTKNAPRKMKRVIEPYLTDMEEEWAVNATAMMQRL